MIKMDNRKEEKMQDEVEKNHRVSFESLEILIRRFKNGTFSEIMIGNGYLAIVCAINGQSYFIHCLEF